MSPHNLLAALDTISNDIKEQTDAFSPLLSAEEVGRIEFLTHGIVRAKGLGRVKSEELVILEPGVTGMVMDILPEYIGIVLLKSGSNLKAGNEINRTGRILDVPVGKALIGRVVDPLGRPLDELGPVVENDRRPVECHAPDIIHRAPVEKPLQTGLKVIDALIPIGLGQRELILGDRQTGKTAIAIDTIVNQKDKNVLCIYCAIGIRGSSIAKVINKLKVRGAMTFTTVVVVDGNDPPGLQYIAPYAATSMGEYFMHQGRDVVIVYDDLTRHAEAYRQLSLLLRRPPGREAFPGDIFYIHSRLLERATHLKPEFGGGSLTALPIIETEAQNISAYIPTNLISITDGQIYLSPELFQKGSLPAVDVGKSVSRIGGKAQSPGYRKVAGDLRLSYSQFQELEAFARFGTRLDDNTRQMLEHGRRVREVLKQDQFSPLGTGEQIAVLFATSKGILDSVPLQKMIQAETIIVDIIRSESGLEKKIINAESDDKIWNQLLTRIQKALKAL